MNFDICDTLTAAEIVKNAKLTLHEAQSTASSPRA
jgi:hypothetical protein